MVMLKVTNSYASVHCAATPAGGGWAWPSCNTAGWPPGCGYAATGQARRSGRCRPARPGQPRCVAPMNWSGCWPRWRCAPSGKGGPR
jgi:hypothetical protein